MKQFLEVRTGSVTRLLNPAQITQIAVTTEAATVHLSDGGRVELDGTAARAVVSALRAMQEDIAA